MDDGESGGVLEPAAYEYCRERFHKYLAEYHLDDVMAILRHPVAPKHHVVEADFPVLYSASQKLGSLLVDYPLPFFELFSSVLIDMQEKILHVRAEAGNVDPSFSVKRKCKVRIVNIAQIGWTPPGGRLPASQDVSRLVVVRATVMRAGVTKMLEFRREMECGSCKQRWVTEADPLQYYAFPKEYKCPSGSVPACDSRKIAPVEGSAECRDYQEIKIQV
jgi:DNA replicative helicase MCM subunit Mcm2 (Cdc46/Mcm family)